MDAILSKRDRSKIQHDGHMFAFDKCSADKSKNFWRCDKRYSDKCPVRLHTSSTTGGVLHVLNERTHGRDAAAVEAAKLRTTLKRRAEDTAEIPSIIMNDTFQGEPPFVLGKLENKDATRKLIQRKRNRLNAAPPLPANCESIVIPEIYKKYETAPGNSEGFVFFDSGAGDAKRFTVFGRESNINWSHQMIKLYVDGTFSLAPQFFAQVYVIMAEKGGFVFTVLYALLLIRHNKHR